MDKIKSKKPFWHRLWHLVKKPYIMWPLVALSVLVVFALSIWGWYNIQLSPLDSSNTSTTLIKIESGDTPSVIAENLKNHNIIRNQTAFLWYTKFDGSQNKLQAGSYRLSPSLSTPQVVEQLKKGSDDIFDITFLPGATLTMNKQVLLKAGFTSEEVDSAFSANYDSPLFASKPPGADLEGYLYGETYRFGEGTPVKQVLQTVFDEFYSVVKENNLEIKYKQHGLTLYQGITLASIVQKESGGDDKDKIAQVFYSRLALGMKLGSDVTYQYITDKLGVPRDTNFDSPYNTRKYTGLPPGPIAAPGKAALLAVANPASTDYLYFLSGDDHVTYFAHTLAEHEANRAKYCQKKCMIL